MYDNKICKVGHQTDTVKRTVTLRGLTPIMFDRYAGDNTTKLEWSQKIYLIPGTNVLACPQRIFLHSCQRTTRPALLNACGMRGSLKKSAMPVFPLQ